MVVCGRRCWVEIEEEEEEEEEEEGGGRRGEVGEVKEEIGLEELGK